MQTLAENHTVTHAMATPDRILVATDLTDTEYLLPHAIAQAKASGARVTLLHVLPPSDVQPLDAASIPYVDKSKIVRDVRVMLMSAARQLESQGIVCDVSIRGGIAIDVIPEAINRTHSTRLIMASHGRGKLGQLVLGSVAHELITHLKIPVFVVGPQARAGYDHTTPRKILFPVSLLGDYRKSLHLALDIAQTYRSELILLHVFEPNLKEDINSARTVEWAKNALESLLPTTTNLSAPPRIIVTSGKLAEEILKAATQTGADWIVLGADGGLKTWSFNESAAYQVVASANCPILTLRHTPTKAKAPVNLEDVHFTLPL